MSSYDPVALIYDEYSPEELLRAVAADPSIQVKTGRWFYDLVVDASAWDGRIGPLCVAAAFALFLIIAVFNAIAG